MKKLWLLPVLALTIVSCESENKGNTITQNFTNGFNYVVDMVSSSDEAFIDDEVGYEMTFNYDNNTADIAITSLQLSADQSNMSVNLTSLPWTYTEEGFRQIYVSNLTVGLNTTISNFRLVMMDRNIYMSTGYAYSPVISISYTVDGRYQVTAFMRTYIYVDNSTRVTNVADGSVYTPKNGTVYGVVLDPKKLKASLLIDGAVFAAGMEAHPVQMTFPELNVKLSSSGYTLTCDETIPTVTEGDKSVPYEAFKITDFTGYASLYGSTSLSYRCANRGNPCDVSTDLDYFTQSTSN